MQLARVPQGPTLLFKVVNFTNEIQKFPTIKPALTILSGFTERPEHRIAKESFRGLFPALDLTTTKEIERVVVVNYNSETDLISIRHFRFENVKGVDAGLYQLSKNPQANV